MTAALQNGPDGDGSVLSGAKALESCAYLAQSMLAHNFRDPSGLDPNYVRPGNGRFIPPGQEDSNTPSPTPSGYTSYLPNNEVSQTPSDYFSQPTTDQTSLWNYNQAQMAPQSATNMHMQYYDTNSMYSHHHNHHHNHPPQSYRPHP